MIRTIIFSVLLALLFFTSGCGTPNYEKTLKRFLMDGNIEGALAIIESGRPCNDPLPFSDSPVNFLASRGDYYFLKQLLESGKCGANVWPDGRGSILSMLIYKSDPERGKLMAELMDLGLNVDLQLKQDPTTILPGLHDESLRDIKFLVENGASKRNFFESNGAIKQMVKKHSGPEVLKYLQNHKWPIKKPSK